MDTVRLQSVLKTIFEKADNIVVMVRCKSNGIVYTLKTKNKVIEYTPEAILKAFMQGATFTQQKERTILKKVKLSGSASKSVYKWIFMQGKATRKVKLNSPRRKPPKP